MDELIDLNEEDYLTNEDPDYESEKFYAQTQWGIDVNGIDETI